MNYSIETIPRFDKDVKKLKKSFPKIKADLEFLISDLSNDPEQAFLDTIDTQQGLFYE